MTKCYRPSEQTEVQALNEGVVFSLVARGSLGAGWLYDRFGWVTLNLAVLPLLLLVLVWTVVTTRRGGALAVAA